MPMQLFIWTKQSNIYEILKFLMEIYHIQTNSFNIYPCKAPDLSLSSFVKLYETKLNNSSYSSFK